MVRIALLVVLLIGGVVQAGWCQEDAEKHLETLNAKILTAKDKGNYRQGISLAKQAYDYAHEHFGPKHSVTLAFMNNLAFLYNAQGRYGEAEPLYKHIFQFREKALGKEHPDTLASMNNLAMLYQYQGRYNQAEPLLKQALQLIKNVLSKEHTHTLASMNNLAMLYQFQGRYNEAEPVLKQVLRLRKKVLGREHPSTLTSMNNLALLYKAQGRYHEHFELQSHLNERKSLYFYNKSESLLKQSVQLSKRVIGESHPKTLSFINNLAGLYQSQYRNNEAELLYKK